MAGASTTDVLALCASIVSALGGGFAAWAAWQSAASAQRAQAAAQRMERRVQLNEVAATAHAVVNEVRRIQARAVEMRQAYRELATLTGNFGGSRMHTFISEVDRREADAIRIAEHAKLFADGARSLAQTIDEDLDRVQLSLTQASEKARTMREDLDRELSTIRGQCTEQRGSMERRHP